MTLRRNKSSRRRRSGRIPRGMIGPFFAIFLIAGCIYAFDRMRNAQQSPFHDGDVSQLVSDSLIFVRTCPSIYGIEKRYEGMDMSFNPDLHIPNWVAWELTADETTGDVPRSTRFSSDESVDGCAETWDYSYSGYDRGHMAPAGDMKWSRKAMAETFYMTNICPQVKVLNTGAWKRLEEKCRQWAQADSAIYIVCGPVIDGKPIEYIGDSKVYVPSAFFKVILSPYVKPARGIGFIMPNGKVTGGMQACAVTIDSVESLTGHDFFSSLPMDMETDVESQCDFHYWSTRRPLRK